MLLVSKSTHLSSALLAPLLLLAGIGMTPSAQAVSVTEGQNASGTCQGALPVFDTQLRKRPLALNNEGTDPAFVSCSLWATNYGQTTVVTGAIAAYFSNNTNTGSSVTCTFVDGVRVVGGVGFFTKTIAVPSNSFASIVWNSATDNGGVPYGAFSNLSCLLPPGTEISFIFRVIGVT